jgi:hypothetical protein
LIASALLLVIAALYFAATVQIPVSTLGGAVGPHAFPTVLAFLLGIIGVSLSLRSLFARRLVHTKDHTPSESEAKPLRALGMLGIGALYIPFAWLFGYVPALFLLITAIALYERAAPSWRTATIAMGGSLLFWLLFVVVLGVRQPQSILF